MKRSKPDDPVFRSTYSEDTFRNKYAHEGCETVAKLADVLVEDVCGDRMCKGDKAELKRLISSLKLIPGGRYLYYAGRKAKFFNNCLGAETRVLTDKGWRRVDDLGMANVLSPIDGKFYPAEFKARGTQPLQKVTFAPVRGSSAITYTVRATRSHHWPLVGGGDTYDLRVGDVVPANTQGVGTDELGFAHGFVFGDGNKNGQLRLCAEKDKRYLERLSALGTVSYPPSADGDPVLYFNHKIDWKSLPDSAASPAYIASFIRGWIAADGHAGRLMCSVNKQALEWFAQHAAFAGLTVSGCLRSQVRDTRIGAYTYESHEIFLQNYSEAFAGFKVVAIEPDSVEEVFCPYEPVHNRIVIDNNIDTYQCYLLRAEEDTREDWANLSWKAESALMTGGGIGTDYSVYRAKGAPLGRTGGEASGPIPKIMMIDHIGTYVMQGGSRRSAMYASLNWQHGDAWDFIKAKDWHNMPINGTNITVWDAKVADFNYKAPLDMTNISVNYDDAWLDQYQKTGDVGPLFRANVEQALRTGEPGFSFNFGSKERETLRNACTEVCSEDDSDVCNLASINMSRIDSLSEFKDIVRLATKFLLCGTFVADLPYEKVYLVRAKNRRLGLGLMGVHEWLLKKRQRYEVTPELHEWLAAYRDESDVTARAAAYDMSCAIPKGVRAIAPTGTIGILAGTSTGIEPIFATAYKRRYLKNGTEWHYQYVVEGAAQAVINQGVSPDNIEGALDLAADFERRIKFQADVQDYVDQSIASTINLPEWGTALNNPDMVDAFAATLAKYAHRIRGFTCYPDAARGGQPLTAIPYAEARDKQGKEFKEEYADICVIGGKGGVCGS